MFTYTVLPVMMSNTEITHSQEIIREGFFRKYNIESLYGIYNVAVNVVFL